MTTPRLTIHARSPEETAALARRVGARLAPGDVLLLEGPIGAGKTHFARQMIQSLMDAPEDVPSPTFTLVQSYESRAGEIWHADLYRLSSTDEIEELGLTDAFESAICLVEWPDRLGPLTPPDALTIRFEADETDDAARHLSFDWQGGRWAEILDKVTND